MYHPTQKSIKREYTILNKKIFGGVLPPSSDITFEIAGNRVKAWGFCKFNVIDRTFTIRLNSKFPSRKLFVNILAHEMVHVFEQRMYGRMGHGPKFLEFRETFKENGLDLLGNAGYVAEEYL